jgi:hypothetical protein
LKKSLLGSFAHLQWLLIPCQMYSQQRFFSHYVVYLFCLVTVSFAMQKHFSFIQSHLSIISFNCWTVEVLFIQLLSFIIRSSVCPIFYYSSFTVSDLTLKSLINFELLLVQIERLGFVSIFYWWISCFPNTIC